MKTLVIRLGLLALICAAASAQRLYVESDTVEGQLLQQIDAESDAQKRLQLLEKFAREFPNHEAVVWVLSHLQSAALESKDYDRVLEIGTRILAVDPNDVPALHCALRAVEARQDVELVKRWSAQAWAAARRVTRSKPPEDPDDEPDWKARVDFAKQVELYTEYSLYFAALNAKDTRGKSDLIEALEQRNPRSEYLAQMRTSQAAVVRQVDVQEAVRSAEQGFEKGEYHIDLLYMAATHYMQKRTAPDKVITYGLKLLEMMEHAQRPEEMDADNWEKRRREILGQTNWMVGLLFSTQERYALADKHLRTSLQYIRDQDMIAGALYHLGYVNYRIAESGERIRIHDAVKFTSECARIASAVQAQAAENLKSMRAEYALPAPEDEQ